MRRLGKEESRKRWRELRRLWNEFDPIGVMHLADWPLDEYETYCGPCMRLLEQDAPALYLEECVYQALDCMAISKDPEGVQEFVRKMQAWFRENWYDTKV